MTPAVILSSVCPTDDLGAHLGRSAYSYSFALRQFAPLLKRFGVCAELSRPESQVDHALWQHHKQGRKAFHLSFSPLHLTYLARKGPNAAFVFWEFPDIPAEDLANNPRNNWVRVAGHLDRILTASTFTRDAFQRAGVTTPIEVVPVPLAPERFAIPDWQRDQRLRFDLPAYIFPQPVASAPITNPWETAVTQATIKPTLQTKMRTFWRTRIKPHTPERLVRLVQSGVRTALWLCGQTNEAMHIPYDRTASIDLGGVVYLSVLNPFDPRKAWPDLLSAFLRALGDREDATLVMKLVLTPDYVPSALAGVVGYYHHLAANHRCKLVLIPDYLSDEQMARLTQAATYHVSPSRAEGANLPLMDALAAGRPAIAPVHSSMADYFSGDLGWMIPSSPEPAAFPHDTTARPRTSWHRLDWQALHDAFRTSYDVAKNHPGEYARLSRWAREKMQRYAGMDEVYPRFQASLSGLVR